MNVTENAYAKINITLDVTGVRPDGYHEVKMIMQDLELHDTVELSRTEKGDCKVTLSMEGAAPDVPCDERNIAVKAALLMRDTYGIPEGLSIHLVKRIPSAAGLAGGSSDAAAVIRGMNRLFGLGLSLNEMMGLGVRLGADVPYCIMGGTALSEGIGEKLTALDTPPFLKGLPVLLVKPPKGVSTREVYTALDSVCCPGKEMTEKNSEDIHPDTDAAVSAIKNGDLCGLCAEMGNILETVTVRMLPEIDDIKAELSSHGAVKAMMSGSGPTVFAFFDEKGKMEEACRLIAGRQKEKYTVISTEVRDSVSE